MNNMDTTEQERGAELRPIWVRAPLAGRTEFYSGLSRGKMYQAEALGLVKTASLKPPGATRGVKLFHLGSLLAFVERCATEAPSSRNGCTATTSPTEPSTS